MRHAVLAALILLATRTTVEAESSLRALSFEDRVTAQEAIERVYYSHQIGTTKPFEQAVPRSVLEGKVRKYLDETAALKVYWKTAVSDQMLQRELERMAQGTRMPQRLLELYSALGNDPFLVKESIARATLVDRLTHNFFALDQRQHAAARRRVEELRRQLVSGELNPMKEHLNRSVVEYAVSESTTLQSKREHSATIDAGVTKPNRHELSPEDFRNQRAEMPDEVGQVSVVKEEPDAFVLSVVLSDSPRIVSVASYAIPKRTWDDWWVTARGPLQTESVAAVATNRDPLPSPTTSLAGNTGADRLGSSELSCALDDTWTPTYAGPPRERSGHVAVWTGDLMVVWGGRDGRRYGARTGGRYDPATDRWSPTSVTDAPSSTAGNTAVWTGSELVVWGGYDTNRFVDTGGRYDPATDTWTPTATTGAPSARWNHSAVWTGSQMLVWGGYSDCGDHCNAVTNTGGRYDPVTNTWTPTSTTGAPPGRDNHTAVWTGSQMLVWGGDFPSTGGRYDPAADTWTPTSTTNAPSARSGHTAVWTGSVMVVWGGYVRNPDDSFTFFNSGGRYDPETDTWTPTAMTEAPAGRVEHTVVWTGNQMVVWGGHYHSGSPDYSPTYLDTGGRYDPVADTWAPTSTTNAPSARSEHTTVWTGNLMVVWGGGDPRLNDGGRYDPATDTWTPMADTGAPFRRQNHAAIWTGNLMVVWGGESYGPGGLDNRNTGGRYDPLIDTWTPTSTVDAPFGRENPSAVWTGSQVLVWGGSSFPNPFPKTGGRYDPTSDTWTPISTTDAPSGRFEHTAIWTGTLMVVWGGFGNTGDPDYTDIYLNDGGRYDPATDTWTPTAAGDAPSARASHTAVWTGSQMVIWGGNFVDYPEGSTSFNTGGRYDPATDTWTPTATTDAPPGRNDHTAVWTGSLMVVWGGYYGLNDGGRYDPATDTWTPTATAGAPSFGETAVWTGNLMVVWGGGGGFGNAGGRYNPATDSWTPTATTGAPSPRANHTAVWTGTTMIVWGGDNDDDDGLNDGGSYVVAPATDADGDGATVCQGDCNDADPLVHPGAPEICNGIDDDCNAQTDEGGNELCDDQTVCTEDACRGTAGCSNLLLDDDGDRVCDASDHCAATILTPTVVIDACNSGVNNHLFSDGCNFGDQIASCREGARNHGRFVSCVAHLLNEWLRVGLITGRERGRIASCAAR